MATTVKSAKTPAAKSSTKTTPAKAAVSVKTTTPKTASKATARKTTATKTGTNKASTNKAATTKVAVKATVSKPHTPSAPRSITPAHVKTPSIHAELDRSGSNGTSRALNARVRISNLPSAQELATPVYFLVGAAEYALEAAKAVPGELAELSARASSALETIQSVPATAAISIASSASKASDVMSQFNTRGQRLVGQIRRQPSTQAAIREGREAVARAESAAFAARNSVMASEKAAAKIG